MAPITVKSHVDYENDISSSCSNCRKACIKFRKDHELVPGGLCVICCYEILKKNVASIDCCKHIFCYGCISEWAAKSSNLCPLCKQKFMSIKHFNQNEKVITEKITNRHQRSDVQDDTELFHLTRDILQIADDTTR